VPEDRTKPPPKYTVRKWADPGNYKGGWAWASPPPELGDTETEEEALAAAWEHYDRTRGAERERVLFLSVVRGACLSDHMGDMWNDLIEIAKMLEIELPEDEEDEIAGISLDKVEEMGGRGIWSDPTLGDYLKGAS
jgi:hypothetical protein